MSDLEVHLSTDDVTLVNNSLEIHLSTDDELTSNLSVGYIGTADLTDYVTKSELKDKGYLTAVPSEYVTESELNAKGYLTEHQDLSGYAKTSSIPTKTSQLTNDSGYLKSIPSEYVTESELNAKGLATETFVTNKIAEASLSGGEVDLSGYVTKDDLSEYAKTSNIPTKTSQLTNDSGYLKSIPSEYVTESELNAKGLATETFVTNKIAEASLSGGSGTADTVDGFHIWYGTQASYDLINPKDSSTIYLISG